MIYGILMKPMKINQKLSLRNSSDGIFDGIKNIAIYIKQLNQYYTFYIWQTLPPPTPCLLPSVKVNYIIRKVRYILKY